MLSGIRFFLSLRGVLKAFRATWQSLMKNEIASLALAMTWFAEYLPTIQQCRWFQRELPQPQNL